jgi:hypothetical protein
MIKSVLRQVAILLSSFAVLSGGLGANTAYARDGGFPYERNDEGFYMGYVNAGQSGDGMAGLVGPRNPQKRISSSRPSKAPGLRNRHTR